MLDLIRKNIDDRMDRYTDSRQPSNDEVAISWLITEIDRLKEDGMTNVLKAAKILGVVKEDIINHKLEKIKQRMYDMTCTSECRLKKVTLNHIHEAIADITKAQQSI